MNDIAERINVLKNHSQKYMEDLQKLEGRREQLLETLKKDFGCNTILEAENKLQVLEKDTQKMEKRIQAALSDLEKRIAERV